MEKTINFVLSEDILNDEPIANGVVFTATYDGHNDQYIISWINSDETTKNSTIYPVSFVNLCFLEGHWVEV